MTVAQQMGVWAEAQAEKILRDAGYSLIHSNYHSRYGEIDLIVSRDLELVFVEVKSRNKTRHGSAIEVITLSKQKKILKTALSFVAQYEQYEQFYYRFDVICFDFTQQIAKNLQQDFSKLAYDQQWIENAFTLDADLINI